MHHQPHHVGAYLSGLYRPPAPAAILPAEPSSALAVLTYLVVQALRPGTAERRIVGHMPHGGSDCCGSCWFNFSNSGQRGSVNFKPDIPSFCEIRDLPIPNPFYT